MAELPYDDHTKAYNPSQVGYKNNSKLLLSDSDMLWDMATINIHSPEGEGCAGELTDQFHLRPFPNLCAPRTLRAEDQNPRPIVHSKLAQP